MNKLDDVIVMKQLEDARKMFEEEGHKKRYTSEAEYRGRVGYEREVLKVRFEAFLKNPSTDEYLALEKSMLLFQNITCNCYWRNEDEEI